MNDEIKNEISLFDFHSHVISSNASPWYKYMIKKNVYPEENQIIMFNFSKVFFFSQHILRPSQLFILTNIPLQYKVLNTVRNCY